MFSIGCFLNLCGTNSLQNGSDIVCFFKNGCMMAINFNQQQGSHIEWKTYVSVSLDAFDGRIVHDLHGRGNDFGCDDIGNGCPGGAGVLEIGQQSPFSLRRRDQLEGRLGDNAECTFTADQQVLECVTGNILDAFAACCKR